MQPQVLSQLGINVVSLIDVRYGSGGGAGSSGSSAAAAAVEEARVFIPDFVLEVKSVVDSQVGGVIILMWMSSCSWPTCILGM